MSSKFRFVLFAVASVVSLSAGCSEAGTPVDARPAAPNSAVAAKGSSTQATTSTEFVSGESLDNLARFRVKPQITIAWAKMWIGPEGGRLDFQGFTMIVPKGAVDKVTMFTIRLPVDPDGSETVLAEFGPHNVTFAQPITIGLPVRGTTAEGDPTAHIVWWNNQWVPAGGVLSADGSQMFTQTPHFSQWALERGGTMLTSGG